MSKRMHKKTTNPAPEETEATAKDHRKKSKNHPGLVDFFEHLKSQANPHVRAPLSWSVAGEEISTLWKKSFDYSLNSRIEKTDWSTRVRWSLELLRAAKVFDAKTIKYLQHATVIINEEEQAEISILGCLYIKVWGPEKPISFYLEDIFWAIAVSLPKEDKLDFLLPFLIGGQVHQILRGSPKPYEVPNGSIVDGIRSFAGYKTASKVNFLYDSDGLPEEISSVLRKMVSFEREERYPSAEEGLLALTEALSRTNST